MFYPVGCRVRYVRLVRIRFRRACAYMRAVNVPVGESANASGVGRAIRLQ
uniref:Uncharacterized protein n=1 Tax=Anopheles minimus TaxID=112268 RepID=A0A182WNC5_9DIPT